MTDLKNLFERITTVPKVRSINGVFVAIDKTLEDTDYNPYYQRNYVWDDEKATYFIETILLGSEVPPIILFKSSSEDGFIHYEVIDGRQRYETICRFLNGELKLRKSGLQKLGDIKGFAGKTYNELSTKYQNLFKDTKIRTIEYSFVGKYTKEEEEALKREIFQRYNSGISPLKSYELDKAKYFYNDVNKSIKELLIDDISLNAMVTNLFLWEKLNVDQIVSKIRELLVLHRIPIQYYANKKQTIVSKYFEYLSTQLDEEDTVEILNTFCNKVETLLLLKERMISSGIVYNRLYAECLFWALSVMEENQIDYNLNDETTISRLMLYLKEHTSEFTTVRSSFYSVLLGRYRCIASFFEQLYSCSFSMAIDNSDSFKQINKQLPTAISSSENTMEANSFEQLRINKPEPTSVELTELLSNLKSSCFILRPPYQRGDVKNKKKSSAIIESMLLGVMLPPIFVFKRKDGISEVIDGQQRLLSIIGYIGEFYKDESGKEEKPFLHNFRLDLGSNAVLTDLNGRTYSELSKLEQNKIRKTSIFIIEIREDQNPDFDPVDLFVRLNNKPYPISKDSFEMWNSFAPRSIIQLIKDVTRVYEKWFYLRKNNCRMDNENIFATLAYFQYMFDRNGILPGDCAPEKTIETYMIDNRVACRFRSKADITKLLYNGQQDDFIAASNKIEFDLVKNLKAVLYKYKTPYDLNKGLDALLSVENGKRTQMSFYILWILLHDIPTSRLLENHQEAFEKVKGICRMINSCDKLEVFKHSVADFRSKYGSPSRAVLSPVDGVARIVDEPYEKVVECIRLKKRPRIDNHFEAETYKYIYNDANVIFLMVDRPGFKTRFVEAYLRSKLFWYNYVINSENISSALKDSDAMPFVSIDFQVQVIKLLDYVDYTHSISHNYFQRLLDITFYQLSFQNEFEQHEVDVIEIIRNLPSLLDFEKEARSTKAEQIYKTLTATDNIIGMYLLKVIDIESVKQIENIGQ